jgi:4-amino-4-deoxy-L-arabinose transferase-like glycosyltransferase
MQNPICAILALAFGLRLGFALWLGNERIYQPDEAVYVNLAKNLCAFGVFGVGAEPGADRPPGLSLLLAGLFQLTGISILAARILSCIISTASLWVLFRYGDAVFGRPVGLWAACFGAIYPFFIYWSGMLMTETLTIFLVLCALHQTQKSFQGGDARSSQALLGGLLWGGAILTRTQNILLPLALASWVLWNRRTRANLRAAAIFLAAALFFPGAWALRNQRYLGVLTLDAHAGWTMAIRTLFHEEDNIDTGVAAAALEKTTIYKEAMALPASRRDRALFKASFEFIAANPGRYLLNSAHNFRELWRFYPRLDKTVGEKSPYLGGKVLVFAVISLMTEPWLIALALFGAYAAWKRGLPIAPACFFVILTTIVHTFVIAQMRYRIPMMPLVILFACYGMSRLLKREECA